MSKQSITDDNLASYALGIKFRDMAIAANSGARYEPKPIQTSVTKEMIQEYQDEQNKPIVIEGRLYKYHPATTTVNLVEVDETKKENTRRPDVIKRLREQQQSKSREIGIEEQKIRLLNQRKQQNLVIINAPIPAEFSLREGATRLKVASYMAKLTSLDDNNREIESDIQNLRDNIAILTRDIHAIQGIINDNDSKISMNQKLEMDVKQENERLLKQQEDNIIALNSGKLSLTRQTGESEQEYLDRMNQIGTVPDESLELQAAYKNTEDLKKMLRQVVKSESIIEDVLKLIPSNDSRFMILKNQKIIIDEIIKRFGSHNPRIEASDIYSIIDKVLSNIYNPPSTIAIPTTAVKEEEEEEPIYNIKRPKRKTKPNMKLIKSKKHQTKTIEDEEDEEPIQGEEVEEYNHDEAIKRKERNKNINRMSQEDETIAEKMLKKANRIEREKWINKMNDRLRLAQEHKEAAKLIGLNPLRDNPDEYLHEALVEHNPGDAIDIKRLMERERKDIKRRNPDNAVNWRDETSGIEINKYKRNRDKELSRIQKEKLAEKLLEQRRFLNEKTGIAPKKEEELESKKRSAGRPTKEESAKIAQEKAARDLLKRPVGRPTIERSEEEKAEIAKGRADKKNEKALKKLQKKGKGFNSDTEEEITRFKKNSESKYIKGFTQVEIPKHIQLGSVIILLKKLYYKNILAVKDHNMINIKGFQNIPVSDSLVEIIMKLCSNEMPNKNLINNLSTSEKHIFNTLIHIAHLHKEVEHSKDITINHLKERINLIEGEIQSGNNNPELLHELQTILYKLVHFNLLSAYQAKNHIQQYKNYYLNV